MIDCPEFDYDYERSHAAYFWTIKGLFAACCIINPYVMYCIVFRSPNQKKIYRWALLFHQITAFLADIWINFFVQGTMFLPFPAGFQTGPAQLGMNSLQSFAMVVFLVMVEDCSDKFQLKWMWLIVFGAFGCLLSLYVPWTLSTNTSEIIAYYKERYSCFTDKLLSLSNFVIADRGEVLTHLISLAFPGMFVLFLVLISLTIASVRSIKVNTMSANLKRLQQKFLAQLVLQTAVPFAIVAIPLAIEIYIVVTETFGYPWLNDIVMATFSTFSITSGIVLIVMNPSYYNWKHWKAEKETKRAETVSGYEQSRLMTEYDKIALSCALQLNLGEADLAIHRSRHQTNSAKALLAVTPALALTAFLVALLLISFIATALIRRRIPSRKYAVILSRTAADVFCSCLVAATSLYANVQSASHALLALFLFVASFGVFNLGLSHIYVVALRYISVTRPYGFQSICSVPRISLALSIAWITSILYAAAYTPLTTVILNPARDVDVCSYKTCQLPLLVVCICIMGIFIPTVFFLYLLVVYKLRQISICEKMHNEPEVTRKKFWKFVGYGGHVSLYIFIVSLLISAAAVLLGQANTYSRIRNLMQKDCDVVEYIDTVNRLELIAGGAVLLWMVRIIFDVTILLLVERKRLMPWASNDLEPLRENTVSIRTHTLQWQKGCFNCPVFNIDAQLNPLDFKN